MHACATLPGVATDRPASTRRLAGEVAWEEIHRIPGPDKQARIIEMSGLSRASIVNVRIGKDNVTPETYWRLAGALGLPTHFFQLIIDGDAERIKRLPGRAVDPVAGLREDLRQRVLDGLSELQLPRSRRTADRKHA